MPLDVAQTVVTAPLDYPPFLVEAAVQTMDTDAKSVVSVGSVSDKAGWFPPGLGQVRLL